MTIPTPEAAIAAELQAVEDVLARLYVRRGYDLDPCDAHDVRLALRLTSELIAALTTAPSHHLVACA